MLRAVFSCAVLFYWDDVIVCVVTRVSSPAMLCSAPSADFPFQLAVLYRVLRWHLEMRTIVYSRTMCQTDSCVSILTFSRRYG